MTEQILGSLNKTLAEKKKEKYDTTLEKKIRENIGNLLPEYKMQCENGQISFQELLKDGIILCSLMNKIVPGKIPKINTTKLAFKQMENIATYLRACQQIGFQEIECFETNDLFEGHNMISVLNHLNLLLTLYERHRTQLLEYLKQRKLELLQSGSQGSLSPIQKQQDISRVQPLKSPRSPLTTDKNVFSPSAVSPETQEKKRPTFWGTGSPSVVPSNASVSSLEHDIATKEEFKYLPELERSARQWIEKIVGDIQPNLTFPQYLKSGVILCKLMNALKPGIIPKINEQNIAYMQMENIERYLQACKELGLRDSDLFNTSDLFNEKNMNLVINNIHILAHFVEKLPDFNGPKIEVTQTRNLFSASLVESDATSILQDDANASIEPLTPEQKDVFEWANKLLKAKFPEYELKNLSTDVRNGIKLLKLLEIVAKVPSVGTYNKEPRLLWHCMQNATLILRFLAQQTFERVEGCRATDIVMGRVEAIVKLLQFIRRKFDLDYMYQCLIGEEGEEVPEAGAAASERSVTEEIVEEIELQPGQELPEHLKQYVASIEESYSVHRQSPVTAVATSSSAPLIPSDATTTPTTSTTPSQVSSATTTPKDESETANDLTRESSVIEVSKTEVAVTKEKRPKEKRHRDKVEKHSKKVTVSPTQTRSRGKRRKSDADSPKKIIKDINKTKETSKEEPTNLKEVAKERHIKTKKHKEEVAKLKESPRKQPDKESLKEELNAKEIPKEEFGKGHEEAKKEPTKLNDETKVEPLQTKEIPREQPNKEVSKEKFVITKESPKTPSAEVSESSQETLSTLKEATKEKLPESKDVAKEESTTSPTEIKEIPNERSFTETKKEEPLISETVESKKSVLTKATLKEETDKKEVSMGALVKGAEDTLKESTPLKNVAIGVLTTTKEKEPAKEKDDVSTEKTVEVKEGRTEESIKMKETANLQREEPKFEVTPQSAPIEPIKSDTINQKTPITQHIREASLSVRKVVLRRPASRRQVATSQEFEKMIKIQKAQATMRQHVANEILQTERNYVKNLNIINERLIQQTKRLNIMSELELASAYSNLPELVNHHKKFESILAARITNWNESSKISDIFLEQTEFFKDYKPYLSNYNGSIISIHYLKKKYPAFAQLIHNFEEEQMATTMFNTESFLIMPVQRIPRYVLLLKDMRKYVAPTSEEYTQLGKAIEHIEKTLQQLNRHIPQTAIEDTKKVLQIADCIEGEENILAPQRVYVKEGPIQVKKIKENKKKGHVIKATTESVKKLWEFFTKKKMQPYWFLFNDLLVYCDVKPQAKSEDTKQFTFVTSISLRDIKEIRPAKKSNKETDFQLVLENEVWKLSCQSAEEKKQWTEEIKKCLEQLRESNNK
jgi:hypothetical protein